VPKNGRCRRNDCFASILHDQSPEILYKCTSHHFTVIQQHITAVFFFIEVSVYKNSFYAKPSNINYNNLKSDLKMAFHQNKLKHKLDLLPVCFHPL
jgi:hypothetical protein